MRLIANKWDHSIINAIDQSLAKEGVLNPINRYSITNDSIVCASFGAAPIENLLGKDMCPN
jgi:hypothetical protein